MQLVPGFPRGAADGQLAAVVPTIGKLIYNGTTFDRMLSANAADGTVGTGLAGAGLLGYDGAMWQRVNATALSDAMAPSTGNLATATFPLIFNGATWERTKSANAAAATIGTGLLGVGLLGYDGTNYQKVSLTPTSDIIAPGNGNLSTVSLGFALNGALQWERLRTTTAATGGIGTGLLGVGILGYDGAAYQRLAAGGLSDNVGAATNNLDVASFSLIFGGTNWERLRSANAASSTTGAGVLASGIMGFDGTNYQVGRLASAANVAATTQPYNLAVAEPGEWSINHTPGSATQATITKAAGGAGVRHVARSISWGQVGVAAIAALQINLRDGITGGGTILWSLTVAQAAGSSSAVTLGGLNIFGTANTAMTLEFSAGPGATNYQSVSLTGYSTI